MTKIRQAKLADCVELLSGFAFKSQQFTDDPDDLALVKGENVSQGHVLWDISKRWPLADWDKFEKFQLAVGDVVIAMDRPWVPAGLKWCFIRDHDPKALLVQRCCRLRANPSLMDQTFLRCVIGGPGFESYIKPITTGVNIPHISGRQILDYSFNLPGLPTQRKIASILSAYDDLIENNLRRIKILEEMAQSLYREWFVHFRFPGHESTKFADSSLGRIPKGWEVKPLFDVATVKYGKMLPKKDLADDGPFPVYGAAKVIGRHTSFTREDRTIICGCRGSVGEMQITEPRCFVTNNSFTFDPVSANIYFWLFYTLSERGLRDVTGGAAQPQITLDGISQVFLSVPPDSVLKVFEKRSRALAELAWNLKSKNQNLRRTRDLLLPQLLSIAYA